MIDTPRTDAVQVPDVDIAYLHKFVNCVPFGEHCPPEDMARAHGIIDTLRDLLKQCKHNASVTMDELGEVRIERDIAESKLAAIEKMGREPSAGMRDAGNEVILNRSNILRAWRLMFAKMMEELNV
jgi:hypothetical protein